ncbi:MAG: TonB-dependent receptor, partial [Pseudomonadota bacterium]
GEKAQFGLGTESDTFFLTSDFLLEGEHASLRLLSGYVDTDQDSAIDFTDGRNPPPAPGILPPIGTFEFGGAVRVAEERLQEGSQDVRIDFDVDGIDFGIGGAIYGRDEEIDVANVVTTDDDGPGGADPVTVLLADRIIDSDLRGVSAYADITATLGIFELSGGVRYTHEEAELAVRGVGLTGPLVLPETEVDDDIVTGFATARAAVAPAVTLFASAKRGFASGGFIEEGLTAAELVGFDSQENWTFEGGVEAGFFDGQVNTRLRGFYIDADDQLITSSPAGVGLGIDPTSDFSNYGFEAEVNARLFRDLTLYGTFGFQDAEHDIGAGVAAQQAACLTELGIGGAAPSCGLGIVTATGGIADPSFTPDITASGGISYDFYIPYAESYVTPYVGFSYRDDMVVTSADTLLVDTGDGGDADARFLVDAGLSLETDDRFWLISLECDNCFDVEFVDTGFAGFSYLGRPMTWTVRARRRF